MKILLPFVVSLLVYGAAYLISGWIGVVFALFACLLIFLILIFKS